MFDETLDNATHLPVAGMFGHDYPLNLTRHLVRTYHKAIELFYRNSATSFWFSVY
jgi:hypothetical protein